MKCCEIVLGALLVIALCSLTSIALDTKVYTLCESNLSMNLTPGFRIISDDSTSQSEGAFSQGFTISSNQTKGIAMLQIMEVYDEDMILYGPEFISNSWIAGITFAASWLGMEEEYKDRTIEIWHALDSKGNNVTVNTISTNDSFLTGFGKTAEVSNWDIGGNRYAGLVSFFDRNTTMQIIETLDVS